MSRVELAVTDEYAGERLDRFLAAVLPGHSRSQIQRLIKEGLVQVGPRAVRANASVRTGDTVVVDVPAPTAAEPAAEDIPLDIAYEDSHLIVVNKAAGMVVHPAAGHAGGTLVNALLHHVTDLSGIGGELRPGIVHRLDRGTSGLIVVAKHDRAHESLARQFHDREVEKDYLALVWGVVQAGRRIEAPIGRDPVNRQKMSARSRRARTAVTRITRVQHLKGVTLAQIAIHTGRTHQIRVHLSGIGHPIAGDVLYGGARRRVPADLRPILRLERPFLHAARLAFTHPNDGRRLEFTAALPRDLQTVLDEIVQLQEPAGDG
jgi:23S rRNA pseudouridine1911/1915/1917 synthase